MKIGHRILSMLMDAEIVTDYAEEYGEPGYTAKGPIVLGDYWCRAGRHGSKPCNYAEKNPDAVYADGTVKLHSMEYHYPRIFDAMNEQGIEFEWLDEWIVDNETNPSKAYRTTGDSYQWESSILWTDGDFLTPENDIEDWIAEVVNDPRRCLPSHVWSDRELMDQGFEEYECGFANGWHEGMNDDPVKITEHIRKFEGKNVDILFKLQNVSQFYLRFCVFIRKPEQEEDE